MATTTNETLLTNETVPPLVQPDNASSSFWDNNDPSSTSSGITSSSSELIVSNESEIIRQTFRLYGSIFLCCFVFFCFLRRSSSKYAKLYNLRSWVPELQSPLANQLEYNYYIGWLWKVFTVSDDELLEHCGMDSICYLRALRLGRYLAMVCSVNAVWLIPLYATAPDSPETDWIQNDAFVLISISHLPNGSPRFLGTVVAAYITFIAAMWLLHRETRWFVQYRHKFLAQRKSHNYAIYVSGIPLQYRSSADLAQYFRTCAGSVDAVLEAHVTMNIPDLESKVNRRDHVVRLIEHTVAKEQKRGSDRSLHHYKIDHRRGRLEKVETIASLEKELRILNRDILYSARQILNCHDPLRSKLLRENACKDLTHGVDDGGAGAGVGVGIGGGFGLRKHSVDGAGALVGRTRARTRTRERLRTGTVDYDYGDAMDDELRKILVPDEHDEHEYDDDDIDYNHDLEANGGPSFFDHYNPDALSTGENNELNEEELLEVIDAPSSITPVPNTFPSNSTLGKHSSSAVMTDPIEEEPSSPFDTDQSSKLTDISPGTVDDAGGGNTYHRGDGSEVVAQSPPRPSVQRLATFATSPLSCDDDSDMDEARQNGRDVSCIGAAARQHDPRIPADDSLVAELNHRFGSPHRAPSSEECVMGLDVEGETQLEPASFRPSPGRGRRPVHREDWSSRRAEQGSTYLGDDGIEPALQPVMEGALLDATRSGGALRPPRSSQRVVNRETSSKWSDRSGGSGQELTPMRELAVDTTRNLSTVSLLSEPSSGRITEAAKAEELDDHDSDPADIRRQDSSSHLSVHSDTSGKSSSRNSVLRSSISTGSRAVVMTSRKAGSGLVTAGSTMVKGSVVASQTLAKGSRAASQSIMEGSKEVSKSIVKGSRVATSAIKKVAKDTSMDKVLESVGEKGIKTIKTTTSIASHVVTSAATVVPILANNASGSARDAGFVVFTNLFSTQAALQMVHHPKPTTMNVQEAPDPKHIFWRNVGMPHRARRTGNALSVAATATLCIFWSIPVAFISSLTEVNSLKQTLPRLGDFIDTHPWAETILALIAPLLLLMLNETVLPLILKYFAAWEGHVSSAMLEASLFSKLGCFMIIQTFFVSIIGGSISAISAELQNVLENPASIVNLLASALPAQSSYFMQILLTSTFLMQSIELLRIYPLFLAFLRRFIGPNLTEKERRRSWGFLRSLEDPPDFWHAETFAQVVLYFVVIFVYATVAPVTGFFLLFCFVLMESGYRYCYIHNYPPSFETGGRVWRCFLQFTLASMIIGQLTLMGLLLLKQSFYAVPALGPLLGITILFCIFLNHENKRVMSFLPTRDCVVLDDRFVQEGHSLDFLVGAYLQPALKAELVEPDYNVDESD